MRSENSGLIDLDALLKEASSGELPKSADDSLEAITTATPSPPQTKSPEPKSAEPNPAEPKPAEPKSNRAPRPQPVIVPKRRGSPLPWLAVVVAVGTIAFLVGFRRTDERAISPSSIAAASTTTTPIVTNESPTPAPSGASGVSLDSLPAAATASASAASSATTTIPAHATPAVAASASAKLGAVVDAPEGASGDLGGAMREAVGPRAPAEIANVDSTTNGSARQLKPSPGAVVGAINSVLPEARACLDAEDPPRSATIVFGSDGKVVRIDFAGGRRPKDECIETALSKARTMPFVEDTFAARATVRP